MGASIAASAITAMTPAVNGVGDFSKLTTDLHGEAVPDVYAMMVLGFRVWWVAAFYLLALLVVPLVAGMAKPRWPGPVGMPTVRT